VLSMRSHMQKTARRCQGSFSRIQRSRSAQNAVRQPSSRPVAVSDASGNVAAEHTSDPAYLRTPDLCRQNLAPHKAARPIRSAHLHDQLDGQPVSIILTRDAACLVLPG